MTRQRGFILPLVILVVVIAATGGGYLYKTSKSGTSPRNVGTQTLNNQHYGFSLSYPPTWTIVRNDTVGNSTEEGFVGLSRNHAKTFVTFLNFRTQPQFNLPEHASLDAYINGQFPTQTYPTREKTTINGLPSYKIESEHEADFYEKPGAPAQKRAEKNLIYIIKGPNNFYHFTAAIPVEYYSTTKDEIQGIVTTFQLKK